MVNKKDDKTQLHDNVLFSYLSEFENPFKRPNMEICAQLTDTGDDRSRPGVPKSET